MRAVPSIFYGWRLVGIALVSSAFNAGLGMWGIGVFAFSMEEELGWSRSALFLALTIRTGLTGLLSPIVGPWRDTRNGPRVLMLVGAIILGVSLMSLKYVESLWQFYLFFGVVGAAGSLGAGGMLTQTILPKWFIRRRGIALGIASTGGAMGPLFFPISIIALISLVGWRDAWFMLGAISLVVLIPLSLLVRTNPEDIGLLPDGDKESPDPVPAAPGAAGVAGARPSRANEVSLTGRQALKTTSFWLIIVAFGLGGLGQQGFQSNWVPYLEGQGFTAGTAALALTVYGFFSVSARLWWGILADRHPVRYLLVIQSLITASTVLLLIYVTGPFMLFAFMVTFGATMGGGFMMRPLLVANYFGRGHIGAITGYMRPFQGVTTAIGPFMVALVYDTFGSYFWGFVAVMVGYALLAAVIILAKPPREQLERQASAAPSA